MTLFDIKKDIGLPIIYYTVKEVNEEIAGKKLTKIISTWNNSQVNNNVSLNNNYTSNLLNHFIDAKNKP